MPGRFDEVKRDSPRGGRWATAARSRSLWRGSARRTGSFARPTGQPRSLEECEALSGDTRHEAELEFPIVFMLGKVASAAGDLGSATRLFEQSGDLGRSEGDHHTTIGAHRNLALIAQRQGEVERAREHHAEALRLADHLQDYSCMMQALAGLANVALEGSMQSVQHVSWRRWRVSTS